MFDQPSRGRHRRPTHFSKSAWLSGSAATTCQEDVSVFFRDECRRMFTCCSLRHSLMCDRNTDVFLRAFCEIPRLKARVQPASPSRSSLRFYLWVAESALLCVATCLLWPGNALAPPSNRTVRNYSPPRVKEQMAHTAPVMALSIRIGQHWIWLPVSISSAPSM